MEELKESKLIHTEEGTFDENGDRYYPISLVKDGESKLFYVNADASERERRWLNNLEFRREMEEKYKGKYVSPIRPLEEFVLLKKDEEGYFEGLVEVEGNIPKGKEYIPVSPFDNAQIPNETSLLYYKYKRTSYE